MPRKTSTRVRRSRSKNFVAIPFQKAVALGALADDAVVTVGLTGNLGEDLFILSVDCSWSLRDLNPGQVPLQLGFSHSDLTVGEVAEALNASLTNPDDIIAKERSRRPVRKAGIFGKTDADQQLDEGRMVRTRIKLSIGNGFDIDGFVQNKSGAVLTTGAQVEIMGTIYGRWQR